MLNYFSRKTGGGVCGFKEALDSLETFKKKKVNQVTAYRGPLEIGTLQISV